jgi:hypothetical protein
MNIHRNINKMVKTRSGKHYNTELLNAQTAIMELQAQNTVQRQRIESIQKKMDKAKENYVDVLTLLVNRQANYRLLTLCLEKSKYISKSNTAELIVEKECCVCYDKTAMEITCKNGHSTCVSCLSSMNWANRCKDFMESTTCPCCRVNFVSHERDHIYDMAGISFGETAVRIE